MPSEPERTALPFEPKGRSNKGQPKSGASREKSGNRNTADRKAKKRRQSADGAVSNDNDVSAAARAKAEKIGLKPKRRNVKSRPSPEPEAEAIPEIVSQRMIRRMLFFSGIPTGLAAVIFVGSYIVLIQKIWEVPTTLVLFSTLGCFGLGVVGVSYGVLSASWEEDQPGSRLGWPEFQVNFRRMASAWRKPKAEE